MKWELYIMSEEERNKIENPNSRCMTDHNYKCANCGWKKPLDVIMSDIKYCPNCGKE